FKHSVEPLLTSAEGVFRLFLTRDVHTATNIASKLTVVSPQRDTTIDNPAIGSISSAQTVFHRERFTTIERRDIRLETAGVIVGMDASGPFLTDFPVEGATGVGEPTVIEVRAAFVCPRYPNQHWGRIGNQPESRFTLA